MHKRLWSWIILLSLVLLGLGLLGCGKDPDKQVLAQVNHTKIRAADLEREIDRLPFHSRAVLADRPGQERLLEEMVKRELLIQEADRRRLDSEPETKAKLEESRRGILLNTLLTEEIFNKVQVSDADVRAYFDKHRDELETSEVHLKQILLKDAKEAEEIRERLLKNESFEEVARKYSADKATGSKGGDLGFLARGQMPPELEKAAFALKPQEVSRIIETPRGYHLLKLVERKKTVSINFDEAKDRLRPYAHAEKQREYLENWLKKLEKKAKVKVYQARLPLSLKTPPGMPPQGPSDMPPGKPPTPPHPTPTPPRK